MLKGKKIVITGASSGIGAEMALLFAQHGAVPILLARSEAKLQEVSSRLPGEHAVYPVDVTSNKQVQATISAVLDKYENIDILINNAGFALFENFIEANLAEFEQMMDVNYMGMVRCTKAVLPSMLERGQGQIINIASVAGKIGVAKSTAYAASKHAVLGFTNSLRQEMIGLGKSIVITAINPGPINTPFFDQADLTGDYLSNLPRWFILKPKKVAKLVLNSMVKKKAEIDIPRYIGWGIKLLQLMPRSWDKLIFHITNKK